MIGDCDSVFIGIGWFCRSVCKVVGFVVYGWIIGGEICIVICSDKVRVWGYVVYFLGKYLVFVVWWIWVKKLMVRINFFG